jgi:hypothetical protein
MFAILAKVKSRTTMSRCSRGLWGENEIKKEDVNIGNWL